MDKIKIAENSYWIGKVDDRKVPFHRLILENGTTYNSYLLQTEKPTIIDTVDISFGVEYVKKLENIMDLNTLQYIVINHVEPDHAGALPALINKAKNATIVTTEKGEEFLKGMFRLNDKKFHIIKHEETLDIGGKTLQFFETPYLHTEETMITYCIEDKVLYPCDIFSTHLANYELFDDMAKEDMTEAFKIYYKLIMSPHRPYVRRMLDIVKKLPIQMIAPSHGYVLRSDAQKYIALYDEMSIETVKAKKALILFSSMTGNTAKLAQGLGEGLEDSGFEVNTVNVKNAELSDVVAMAKEADAILIGSSTRYGDMIGNIEEFIKEIVKLDLSDKVGTAFGSYGWSGEAIEIINDYLKSSNIKLIETSMIIKLLGDNSVQLPLRVNFTNQVEKGVIVGNLIGEFAAING